MKKKIVIINSIVVFVMLILVFGLGVLVTKNNNLENANTQVKTLTKVYSNYYKADTNIVVSEQDIRVTIIDKNGVVLFDNVNDFSKMENHLEREEIISALSGENKTIIRNSETLNKELLYYAEKVEIDGDYVFVRVAVPIQTINSYITKSIPLMLCFLFIIFGAEALISIVLNTLALKPLGFVKNGLQSLNNGNYKPIQLTKKDRELNELFTQINEIGEKLSDTINTLNDERDKLNYILNHITNGVIVIGENGEVVLANDNALKIFNITSQIVGKSYVSITDSKLVLDNIQKALQENSSLIFDFESIDRNYVATFKNIEKGFYILILADVTDSRKNEAMRSEFFANASHELKTPLTALRGFNDLALLGEKDETIKSYLMQMDKDIKRVLVLIDDMLKLSKLEHTKAENIVSVDMLEVANEVIEELKPKIVQKGLDISICGSGKLKANKDDVFILQKNLIENAVHYTEQGGKIEISIKTENGKKVFTVKDTGIGIDSAHQTRIFERFYRVEKSRSRQTGGTGLGLSIVKHIAERYNASISLESKIGVGTTISVFFNK